MLVDILKKHKEAIGWHISNLKGINPAYCMHRIMMEDDYRPVRQPQRRLNPTMKEEVKKKGAQTSGGWAHIPHLRQCLCKPNTGGS